MSNTNEKKLTDNSENIENKLSNEDLIAKLEAEKLRREIAVLDLTWWKRPAYLALAIPIIIAVFGFFSALLSGYFSSKRAMLKAETKSLTAEKEVLQIRIDETYKIGKLTLSDAKNIISNLNEANSKALGKVGRFDWEENNVDSVFVESLMDLYQGNIISINEAADRINQFILRLEILPTSNEINKSDLPERFSKWQ